MQKLVDFLLANLVDPSGEQGPHVVDTFHLKFALKETDPAPDTIAKLRKEIVRLTLQNRIGQFADMDPLDGIPHDYMEIGMWIGDQALAMGYMAACKLLGLGELKVANATPIFFADSERLKEVQASLNRENGASPEV